MAQRIGIKAGANLAFMQSKPECTECNSGIQPGFQAGAMIRFPVNNVLALESGLLFSSRGSQDDISFSGASYDYRRRFYYLDIPLTANLSFPVGGVRFYGEAGPYLGIALAGSIKEVENFNGMKSTENYDIKFDGSGDEEENMKRMDAGLLVGAGLEFRAIRVGFSYGYGLANVLAYNDGDFSLKHRFLSVSLGYWFGDGK